MSSSLASKLPLDIVKCILSFNDKILSNDNRIIGKLDKNSLIHKLLLQKRLIKESRGFYKNNGVTHFVLFNTGHQILFGNLSLNNDIWINFRIRGTTYSRDHKLFRSYIHLLN